MLPASTVSFVTRGTCSFLIGNTASPERRASYDAQAKSSISLTTLGGTCRLVLFFALAFSKRFFSSLVIIIVSLPRTSLSDRFVPPDVPVVVADEATGALPPVAVDDGCAAPWNGSFMICAVTICVVVLAVAAPPPRRGGLDVDVADEANVEPLFGAPENWLPTKFADVTPAPPRFCTPALPGTFATPTVVAVGAGVVADGRAVGTVSPVAEPTPVVAEALALDAELVEPPVAELAEPPFLGAKKGAIIASVGGTSPIAIVTGVRRFAL